MSARGQGHCLTFEKKTFNNLLLWNHGPMSLKLDMWHRILEYFQDCSNSGLGLTLTHGKIEYDKMLEYKISCKVLNIFIQEGSNDDLGLTLSFSMARSNLRP